MSWTEFKSQVKSKGLARSNRYEVIIPRFPASSANGERLLTLFCDATNLPGMNILTQPQRFYGEAWELPYERSFDPVTLSFYMDSNFEIKEGFDRWQSRIINPTSRSINYYNDYVQDIEIRVLNVDDRIPYSLTLYEAYPKTINSIQLDAAARDVMKLQVVMQYRYWTPTSIVQQTRVPPQPVLPGFRVDPRGVVTGSGVANIRADTSRFVDFFRR
jgi:hypothetical protein